MKINLKFFCDKLHIISLILSIVFGGVMGIIILRFCSQELTPNGYRILQQHDRYIIQRHYGRFDFNWRNINYTQYEDFNSAEKAIKYFMAEDSRVHKKPVVVKTYSALEEK